MIDCTLVLLIVIINVQAVKMAFDRQENFCSWMYANETLPQSPNNMDENTFYSQPCFCDEDCWKYGDCCEDASSLMTSENLDRSVNIHKCEKITGVNHSVYVVKTCPTNWSDGNTRSLCLKEVKNENYHYMLDVPVYSLNSGRLYANTFCSICNNDRLNASFLKFKAVYNTLVSSRKSLDRDELENNSSYIRGQLSWILPDDDVIIASIVDRQFNNVRKCRKIIDKCANNWTDAVVLNLCQSYNYYNIGCSGRSYKNIHCAKCNYDVYDSQLCIINKNRDTIFDQRHFNWLLDFQLTSNNAQCRNSYEIYDKYLDACVPILCGENYDLIDGNCQLKTELHNQSDNNSIYSCIKIAVTKNELHMFPNGTIYRNKTQTIYNESEYEISDNDTYLVCINDDKNDFGTIGVRNFSLIQSYLTTTCLSISLICLILHIIIHCLLTKYKTVPGKNILSLSIALFIGQLLYLVGISLTECKNLCFAVGVLIHFFYLSVFFWMNVMAIDICRTLSQTHKRTWKNTTYYYYSAYSWLLPLIIVITSICIDKLNPASNIRPHYGRDVCWISDRHALFLFFALPIAILLIVNLIIFLITTYNDYKIVQRSSSLSKASERTRYHVYVKLAFVLGLTWAVGFAAAFTDFEPLWYGFIILNASQGTFIFILFILKQQVLRELREKLADKTSEGTSNRKSEILTLKQNVSSDTFNA